MPFGVTTPMLNRGTAFTHAERRGLGLEGLLPSGVSTLDGQLRRVYAQYQRQSDNLANASEFRNRSRTSLVTG